MIRWWKKWRNRKQDKIDALNKLNAARYRLLVADMRYSLGREGSAKNWRRENFEEELKERGEAFTALLHLDHNDKVIERHMENIRRQNYDQN